MVKLLIEGQEVTMICGKLWEIQGGDGKGYFRTSRRYDPLFRLGSIERAHTRDRIYN